MSWRALVLGAGGLVSCGGVVPEDSVRSSFNQTYGCPAELVEVRQVEGGRYEASGCDHRRHYVCPPGWCRPDGVEKVETANQGKWLELELDHGSSWVKLSVQPSKDEVVIARLGQLDPPGASCQFEAMVDGQRLDLPHEPGKALSLRFSRDTVRDLGLAGQVGFGTCGEHWSLDQKQLANLKQFVIDYETELGWQGKARSGANGGKQAPLGGWPAWQALGALPATAATEALQPTQLFERLAPSIVRVEAQLSDGMALGSAVAVTSSLLITNCHIVAGSKKVVVKQHQSEWPARLVRSDPKNDRCVLDVAPAILNPITSVRAYSDLKIGEAVYTLGNPSGLDLSLSDGLLSGLREDEGVHYVQTTAPISPGSSGGGLFDAHGNLIGITTLSYVGREKLNQSLNFAIAADGFWAG
jgi:hypothetical protein